MVDTDRIYPCADCGTLRSKDEGGTTFTVCDECWDKHWAKFKPIVLNAREIPGASEYVRVRREDLEKAIDFMEHTAGIYWSGVKDRLKAALETPCPDQ